MRLLSYNNQMLSIFNPGVGFIAKKVSVTAQFFCLLSSFGITKGGFKKPTFTSIHVPVRQWRVCTVFLSKVTRMKKNLLFKFQGSPSFQSS